jgi:hypothetical protein
MVAGRTNGRQSQVVGAYHSVTANAGRYEIEGNRFTTRAYVAKNPDYMDAWPENTVTFSFSIHDDMLEITTESGNSEGAKRTYRKVEGSPAPWK